MSSKTPVNSTNTIHNGRAENRSRKWWRQHFDRWQSSGLSKADYCKSQGLKAGSFYSWSSQFQNEEQAATRPEQSATPSTFIKAVVKQNPTSFGGVAITVQDVTLRFDHGVSHEELGGWVKALRSAVC